MPKLASNCVRRAVVGESPRASRCWIRRRGNEPARSEIEIVVTRETVKRERVQVMAKLNVNPAADLSRLVDLLRRSIAG